MVLLATNADTETNMKAILAPMALAIFASTAQADHRNGIFFGMGGGDFSFGFRKGDFSARVSGYAPVIPCPPVVRCEPVGRYEWRERKVYSPGYYQSVWCDPVYDTRFVGHRKIRVCLRPGRYRKVWHDGTYRIERYRVRVPGDGTCG